MTIKTFDFPSFEEWNKTQEYTQKIGDYTCAISIVTFGVTEIFSYQSIYYYTLFLYKLKSFIYQ